MFVFVCMFVCVCVCVYVQLPFILRLLSVTPRLPRYFLYSWFRASSFYINKTQQDATDADIYSLQTYSTCFGCLSHPSSGVHQTVTAASGTGHSISATTFCRQRGLIRSRWQKVFALIRDMTCTRSCSYSLMYS